MWLGYYKAIKESFGEYKMTVPNFTINDSLTIYGTDKKVVLFTKGKGHTESDLVLWLPDDKVFFTGDLLFVKCHPWLVDGFVIEWAEYLEDLSPLNAEFIIPGHGSVTTNKSINTMINYIQTVTKIVDDAIENKIPEGDLKLTAIPVEFQDWWFGRFFVPNVVNLYELKTGKFEE